MIPFNKPLITGEEKKYLFQALNNNKFSGDGDFSNKCAKALESKLKCPKVLLTPSCTASLELAAMLANINKGDEVIMPSYTFVSTANAFVLRGAKIIFVDIRPDTMNIDENIIERAISNKTKAIVVVHYAGVACEMNKIIAIAKKHHLLVIEDAAQGLMSKYNTKYLGTLGDIGCISFHETKNYQCGEGGAILLNKPSYINRAEIIREKGTNRSQFYRGEIDKYTWKDIGSSYLLNEISSAFLFAQLDNAEKVLKKRLSCWDLYYKLLKPLEEKDLIELPIIPKNCSHNGHIFYLKTKNLSVRTKLINYLKSNGIMAVFHYIPLHNSPAGKQYGKFFGKDVYTTKDSERLVRLPLYYELTKNQINFIVGKIYKFYNYE